MITVLINIKVENSNFAIESKVITVGKDIVIIVGGGSHHIGAVGVSFPTVSIITGKNTVTTSVITLPSHKDDLVAKNISEKVSRNLNKKVTVIAGIHFDALSRNDIKNILKICDELADKIIKHIKNISENN